MDMSIIIAGLGALGRVHIGKIAGDKQQGEDNHHPYTDRNLGWVVRSGCLREYSRRRSRLLILWDPTRGEAEAAGRDAFSDTSTIVLVPAGYRTRPKSVPSRVERQSRTDRNAKTFIEGVLEKNVAACGLNFGRRGLGRGAFLYGLSPITSVGCGCRTHIPTVAR